MTTAHTLDARQATAPLRHGGREYTRIDLPAVLGQHIDAIPYVLRILAENVARTAAGDRADRALAALRAWPHGAAGDAELDLTPGRLLMHDTTSTPALVDIAAMRDALAEAGHDPAALSPLLPVDVSIDHSTAVEAYGHADAAAQNLGHEMRRNAERFAFLKWAAQVMPTVRLNPPGSGIMHTINLEQLATVVTTQQRDGATWAAPDVMLGTDSHTPI
ncbi:aconitase, partial [Kineosphaera limosa NBRC 100340]